MDDVRAVWISLERKSVTIKIPKYQYEVWQSGAGNAGPVWTGYDQEEGIIEGMKRRKPHVLTELQEVRFSDGYRRMIARWENGYEESDDLA